MISLKKIMKESDGYEVDLAKLDTKSKEFGKLIKGKRLGNLPVIDVKFPMQGMVEFQVNAGKTLEFLVYFSKRGETETARIDITSPNKGGIFRKELSGRNASIEGVWKTVQDIYDGKIKK
jgi:hypothetical protein